MHMGLPTDYAVPAQYIWYMPVQYIRIDLNVYFSLNILVCSACRPYCVCQGICRVFMPFLLNIYVLECTTGINMSISYKYKFMNIQLD